MTSHRDSRRSIKVCAALGSASLILMAGLTGTGCTKAPPPPPPPPPSAPIQAPAPPKPKTVADLMLELNIDPRVMMTEEAAPSRTDQRRAVLEFFDAFCRGDDTSLTPMLSEADRDSLANMVASGKWKAATTAIKQVEIRTGPNPAGDPCALAVISTGPTTFQAQMWEYAVNPDGTAAFNAVATPPNIMNLLSGGDWISAWFGVLDKELALAEKPDEEIVVPKSDKTEEGGSGGATLGAPSTPGNNPGFPGKRQNGGRKFKRPGP